MTRQDPQSGRTDATLDFRTVFILALVTGLTVIGYGQVIGDALISVLGPLLVMAGYLVIGRRYTDTGEKVEQFADSIYYLGFLFTLIALTASLLAFRTAEIDINLLVANFALALVTTIFGLATRIVIINFRNPAANQDQLQDILDHQTAKLCRTASQISRELERINREITDHHEILMSENKLQITTAYRAVESLSEDAGRSIREIAETTRTEISQTLSELGSRLESIDFPEQLFAEKLAVPIARFAEKMDETGILLSNLQNRQQSIQDGMQSFTKSVPELEKRIGGLDAALGGFNQQMKIDQGARKKLVELAQAMSDIIASSTSLTGELHTQTNQSRQILSSLSDIAEQMNKIPREVEVTTSAVRQSTQTLIKSTTALASHTGTLREHLDGFGNDLGELRRQFSGLDQLAGSLDKIVQATDHQFKTLQSRSESLSGLEQSERDQLELIRRHQKDLQKVLAESRAGLEGITNHFVKAVEYVTEKLRA